MRHFYKEIEVVIQQDDGSLSDHLNKLFEEVGEVAQDINKFTKRKSLKSNETLSDVKENLTGEIASVIQLLFALAIKTGISYEELEEKFYLENDDYKSWLETKK